MENLVSVKEKGSYFNFVYRINKDIRLRMIVNGFGIGVHFYLLTSWRLPINLHLNQYILSSDNKFIQEKIGKIDINDHFYEFIRKLKKEPSYRVKLIPYLSEELRHIWNNV